VGILKVAVGKGDFDAGHDLEAGAVFVRVTGGARLSSADLRYPRHTLWADYARAGAGVVLCGAPLLLADVNRWVAVLLGAGFVLFSLFLGRTVLRQLTRFRLGSDTLCADGPAGSIVEWERIDRLKLGYYSTKRDRTSGWMQLSVGSSGHRLVRIDSSLDGFHDIVERAAHAAEAHQVELSAATRANLRSMGIVVSSQELAA
jgi:hypothetical protein